MHLRCPNQCHKNPVWSCSLITEERYEQGEYFQVTIGDFCDQCDAEVYVYDPEVVLVTLGYGRLAIPYCLYAAWFLFTAFMIGVLIGMVGAILTLWALS